MSDGDHQKMYEIFMRIENSLGRIDESLRNINQRNDGSDRKITDLQKKTEDLQDFNVGLKAKVGVISTIFGISSGAIVSAIVRMVFDR